MKGVALSPTLRRFPVRGFGVALYQDFLEKRRLGVQVLPPKQLTDNGLATTVSNLADITIPSLSDIQAEQARRRCKTLHGFTTEFWPVIEPRTEFKDNWHLHVVCEHLEACIKREIRKLVINIPPRTMKSIAVSVMLTPWTWGPGNLPEERFLYATYSSGLSARDSRQSRKVIASPKYQDLFGHTFSIRKGAEKDTESKYENDVAGYRLATSVGGTATGEGGSVRVLDDPHKAAEAQSDTIREGVIEWIKNTFSTRQNDPATDVDIIVMQRLHERDATGYTLAEVGGYEHLRIPMEFDGERRKTFLGYYDPRKTKGELLWPDRFPKAEVVALKRNLGQYGASGQLQQDPSPEEGGILKTKFIKLWPKDAKLPIFKYVLQSWDGAFTERTENDPTGMLTFGVFEHKGKFRVMLIDAWEDRLEYPELRKRAKEEYKSIYGEEDGGQHGVDEVLIEDKGSGISLRQDLQRTGVPARPYNPGKMDKKQRAHLTAPLIEAGLFYVPESSQNPGKPVGWAEWALKQLRQFPNAAHDEAVDCFTQGAIYLRDSGWITIDPIPEEDEEPFKKRKVNPYAS